MPLRAPRNPPFTPRPYPVSHVPIFSSSPSSPGARAHHNTPLPLALATEPPSTSHHVQWNRRDLLLLFTEARKAGRSIASPSTPSSSSGSEDHRHFFSITKPSLSPPRPPSDSVELPLHSPLPAAPIASSSLDSLQVVEQRRTSSTLAPLQ